MNLSEAETRYFKQLPTVEYWGDLNVSLADYELLKQALRKYKKDNKLTYDGMLKNYPICMVTFAVFLARYEYNGDFWGPFADNFDDALFAVEQSAIGKKILAIMRRMGFDVDSKTFSRKYVDAIIHQACLPPQSNFAGFFYALSTNSTQIFNPEELLDELQNERAYLLHEPAKHFLEDFQDTRAIDFLVDLHENTVAVDSGAETNEPTANLYREWKASEKSRIQSRNKNSQEFQLHPYLSFDGEGRGLCIVLPDFILSDEWVTEAKWEIIGAEGFKWVGQNRVFEKNGHRYVRERTVAAQAQTKYNIRLCDADVSDIDEKPLYEETVRGIAEDGILLFDSMGRLVRGNYFTTYESTLIVGPLVSLYPNSSLQIEFQYYPNQGDYGIYSVKVLESDARLVWQDKLNISRQIGVRTHTTLKCVGNTIFGVPTKAGEIPTFVCAPAVSINGDKPLGMKIYVDGIESDFSLEAAHNTVDLTNDIGMGRHSIRAYCGGRFLCMTEFYLLPDVDTNYEFNMQWTGSAAHPRTIFFVLPSSCRIEFDGLESDVSHDNRVRVDCPEGLSELSGNLIFSDNGQHLCAPFHLPLSPVSIVLVDSEASEESGNVFNARNYSLTDFKEKDPWLTVKYTPEFNSKQYQVQLVSVDGVVQSSQLTISHNCSRLNLGIFADSLSHMPLPAIVQLVCLDYPNLPLRILKVEEKTEFETRARVGLKYFMFRSSENLPDDLLLEILRYGSQQKPVTVLSCKNKKQDKTKKWWGIPLQQPLEDGIYFIRTQTDNLSFFEEVPRVCELLKSRNNVVLIRNGRSDLPESIDSVVDLIDCLISEYLCGIDPIPEKSKSVSFISNPAITFSVKRELNDAAMEKLLVLSEFATMDSTSKKWKQFIEKAMRYIGQNSLDHASRYGLLQKIGSIGCSEKAFDACWQYYSLYPFALDSANSNLETLARAIVPYSDELALVLLLHSGKSIQHVFGIRRFWELVGEDSLLSFITTPGIVDPPAVQLAQRKFLYEQSKNGIVIQMDDEITGKQELLSQMIEQRGFIARIDYQKAPNTGKVFGRITYADLYTNWLRINDRDLVSGSGENSWKKNLMIDAVKKYQDILVKAARSYSFDLRFARYVGNYFEAIAKRKSESCLSTTKSIVSIPRFFYLEGVAAFLCAVHSYLKVADSILAAAQGYMVYSIQAAPRMAQRDILCAETYLYLKAKETEICQ